MPPPLVRKDIALFHSLLSLRDLLFPSISFSLDGPVEDFLTLELYTDNNMLSAGRWTALANESRDVDDDNC